MTLSRVKYIRKKLYESAAWLYLHNCMPLSERIATRNRIEKIISKYEKTIKRKVTP
jgi:hypothetical protein